MTDAFYTAGLSIRLMRLVRLAISLIVVSLLGACALWKPAPPQNAQNLCAIFKEKPSWYKSAKEAEKRWGSPISTTMAFVFHESSFRARIRPPRRDGFWIFPGKRMSSAYGYAQAQTSTWKWYQKSTGRHRAERHSFADAVDFIGWYNHYSHTKHGISLMSPKLLYFAYHEGHGGYSRASYRTKPALIKTADRVMNTASKYKKQLANCRAQLDRPWWKF